MQPDSPNSSAPTSGEVDLSPSLPPVAANSLQANGDSSMPPPFAAPIGGQPPVMAIDQPASSGTQATPAVAASPASNAAPAMADDGDLIEKEWVNQVKRVVRETAHDPYELNRRFTELKADYMQKRYGKSIKLD